MLKCCKCTFLIRSQRIHSRKVRGFFPSASLFEISWKRNLSASSSAAVTGVPAPTASSKSSLIPHYKVAKITDKGNVSFTSLSITEILKRVHARDLFSLALTSSQEHESKKRSGRITGSTRSTIGNNTRRNKRSPTAILPRHGDIIVSFGSIRAVVGMDEGWIFDAHKPSIQLFAQTIGDTFAIHDHQKRLHEQKNQKGNQGLDGESADDDCERKDYYHGRFQRLTGLSSYNARIAGEAGSEDSPTELQQQQQPMEEEFESFELIFLEEILRDVCATYNRRLKLYEPVVDMVVTRVSNEMYAASGVHRLVPVKDSLQEFELNIQSALEGITGLLEDDEDMLGLLLTERLEANNRNETIQLNRHESVELLLEEYARQLSNILQETKYLLKKVQSKQELVAISLDAHRNRMLRMNLYLSIAGVGIASGTAIAGFYGMNLINGYEDSASAFYNVVGFTSLTGLLFGVGCVYYIRGSASTSRTMERLREIEVIDGALSKMGAVDYTMKCLADNKKVSMTKKEFREKLYESQSFQVINDLEVDLLFGSLDVTKDGYLSAEDFTTLADVGRRASIENTKSMKTFP